MKRGLQGFRVRSGVPESNVEPEETEKGPQSRMPAGIAKCCTNDGKCILCRNNMGIFVLARMRIIVAEKQQQGSCVKR
jgi:hypothetical protein